MNFRDEGIIISKSQFKEKAYIVKLITKEHGIRAGVININKTNQYVSNAGNYVDFFWQARLAEHLGSAKCELIKNYNSQILMNKTLLYAFNSIVSLIIHSFHEQQACTNMFIKFKRYIQETTISFCFRKYFQLEADILSEAGYAMRLDSCIVTGSKDNLCYVSPKSASAVSFLSGNKYQDKLLNMPSFLHNQAQEIDLLQQTQALYLTGYFFKKHIFINKEIPKSRELFANHIASMLQ